MGLARTKDRGGSGTVAGASLIADRETAIGVSAPPGPPASPADPSGPSSAASSLDQTPGSSAALPASISATSASVARWIERWTRGRGGGSKVSSGPAAERWTGVPSPRPSPSINPCGAPSATAWVIDPVNIGEAQAPGSNPRLSGLIGSANCRWMGGRKAHPIGDGAGAGAGEGVPAPGAPVTAGADGALSLLQGHDQAIAQRSSLSRLLIAPISWT